MRDEGKGGILEWDYDDHEFDVCDRRSLEVKHLGNYWDLRRKF